MKHQKLETTPEISKRTANIKLKKGTAETALAKALWLYGIRYLRNYRQLPGSPDIAITKYKVSVFIDGEFWHGQDWRNQKAHLKKNRDYWVQKIEENIARDLRNDVLLEQAGWTVMHFWEKEVLLHLNDCILSVIETLTNE